MHEVALLSRLRAQCANTPGVDWTMEDTTVDLARKLLDANPVSWQVFSQKYNMMFDYDSGTFIDLIEMAVTLVQAKRSGNPELVQQALDIEKRLGIDSSSSSQTDARESAST